MRTLVIALKFLRAPKFRTYLHPEDPDPERVACPNKAVRDNCSLKENLTHFDTRGLLPGLEAPAICSLKIPL